MILSENRLPLFRTTLQAAIYIAGICSRQKKIGAQRLQPAGNAAD
jgi:hypothetical protein